MSRIDERLGRLGLERHKTMGIIAVAGVALLLYGTYAGIIRSVLAGSTPEVSAVFRNVATLREGDLVRVRGVNVGKVEKLESVDGGRATKVTMSVDEDAGEIHADARAKVAWRTLLGGAFAVNLDPGREESGKLSGDIPLKQTSSQVELDDITSVVAGDARRGLKQIPPQLTDAMRDPQTLKDLGETLDEQSPSIEQGLNAARGTAKDRDLQALVTETTKTVKALDAPDDGLNRLVSGAGGTLQVTAAREADLRATIGTAPGVLRNTDITLARLDTTLGVLDPVVDKLRDPAGKVAPALIRLSPVVRGGDRLLTRATPLLRDLRPAVSSLAAASRRGTPLLEELQPSITRLDKTILPYFNETDPETTHTTAEMVGPGLGGLANVAAPFDSNGHVLRFPFTGGSSPLYLPCQVYAGNPDKTKAIECRNLSKVLNDYLTFNPLDPAPGSAPSATTRRKNR
ncbi:hypothetical protein DSM112329_00368 [Paraconexibacter sp. AEG42_29]|uniref:Mce/MlaD domain-containing protein n=1 Tax=Paraconexibacter sp. AEG42_29 TaxID=2997339 RepID=A0AAU7APQ3_9ACTN